MWIIPVLGISFVVAAVAASKRKKAPKPAGTGTTTATASNDATVAKAQQVKNVVDAINGGHDITRAQGIAAADMADSIGATQSAADIRSYLEVTGVK